MMAKISSERSRIIILMILFLCLIVAGCDLFSTRDAEPPNKPRSDWTPAASPAELAANFVNAIQGQNVDNYMFCFVDTLVNKKQYRFVPSGESMLQYSSIFAAWNLQSERSYFQNIKAKLKEGESISLILSNEKFSSVQNDSMQYSANYQLTFVNSTLTQKQFKGGVEMTFYRNISGYWEIGIWSDYKTENVPTWSQLKGSFGN